jgi:hypothetical protein
MSLTNYSDLKTSVANYLARTDLTDQIPDFIRLAEYRMRREVLSQRKQFNKWQAY